MTVEPLRANNRHCIVQTAWDTPVDFRHSDINRISHVYTRQSTPPTRTSQPHWRRASYEWNVFAFFFLLRILVKVSLFEKSFNYIIVVTEPAQTDVRSRSCRDWYVIDTSRRLLTALILLRLVKSVRKCVRMGVVEIASDSWRTGDFFFIRGNWGGFLRKWRDARYRM